MNLQKFFEQNPAVAVAFSGGVDSAYLLYTAKKWAKSVVAYYVKSPFQPQFELDDGEKVCRQLDAELKILPVDVLASETICANPANRCYYCKQVIFKTILAAAWADGFEVLLDGTNFSDRADDRPGMAALRELGVRSPLRECELTKAQVRQLSKEAGLFTWDKPAYACLATRIPAGQRITKEALERTEKAEMFLDSMGFRDFRVRSMGDCAKIQVQEAQLPMVLANRALIVQTLSQWYSQVLLDLEVRL